MVLMRCFLFSLLYRLVRALTKWVVIIGSKRDLERVVSVGAKGIELISRTPLQQLYQFKPSSKSKTLLFDLEFDSPLTFAAFESHHSMMKFWLDLGIGGGIFKTIMPKESVGNARPRLQEVNLGHKMGLFNAMGLPGPGIDTFLDSLNQSDLWQYDRPLGISVGGHSLEDYKESFQKISNWKSSQKTFVELNISCPNTPDGQLISQDPNLLQTLLNDLREINKTLVIGVKLPPDMTNEALLVFAEIVKPFNSIYLNLGNTQVRTREALGFDANSFSMPKGGLSGPALFERTCEMVSLVSPTNVPIIATGGVRSVPDIKLVLEKGATLAGMATQLVSDPFVIPKI